MAIKAFMQVSAVTTLLLAGAAQADYLPADRIDEILRHGSEIGFSHYEEIEAKSRSRVELEGWLDNETYAEVVLSLADGTILQEERKRLITGAWGMSDQDVRQAFDLAIAEGMVEFEEIDIDKQGMIEVEGRDSRGRDLEVYIRQGSSDPYRVERD
ncbi:hypothetical protein [Alkalilimnicola ehrlichii]|uniref:hypothetical protein n=1 Tax=Alkalilimnicola ehrlichii TaxID=351052 RepID=UPI003BA2708F